LLKEKDKKGQVETAHVLRFTNRNVDTIFNYLSLDSCC
jgi:hypothetical protein